MNQAAQVTLEDALELAKSHHVSGNLLLAERTYKDVLAAYPDHFDSMHMLGVIYYQRGNIAEALKTLNQARELDPDHPQCLNNLAIMQSEIGQKAESLETWGKAIALSPDEAEPYSNMANTLWELERFAEAQEKAQKAVDLKEDYGEAWINLGNAYQGQEQLEEAVRCWEKALDVQPGLSKAYGNLGNAYHEMGKFKDSEEMCRKALESDPKNVIALNNLGNALRDQGKPKEAEEAYKNATRMKPNFKQAHNNMAIALIDQQKFAEAAEAARYAIAFDENYGDAWTNLSAASRELGDFAEAEEAAQRALTLKPDSAQAYIALSDILFVQDRIEEAEVALEEAQKLEPDSPRLYLKLSEVLERSNKIEEAIEAVEKAADINPEMFECYIRKAQIYFISNQLDKAQDAIKVAEDMAPDSFFPLGTKAEIFISRGELDKAEETIRKAISINDKIPSFYMSLAKISKFDENTPELKKMEELATHIDTMGRQNAVALSFALYDAYEDFGAHDKAFEYLKKGNDIKRTTIPYNPQANKQSHKNVISFYTPETIKGFDGKGYDSDVPIFILGMPRSGTTLTEQILSAHPDVYAAGELLDLGVLDKTFNMLEPDNAKDLGKAYIDRLTERYGEQKRITDKMPGNYMRIGQILMTLPNAKIVHCYRNPIDNCLSCYKQLFARGQYWSYNMEELAAQYRNYKQMMDSWREIFPGRFLEFQYEDTVGNFEDQARRLIDYVDLEWNDACLEPHKSKRSVLTASKTQVIKPVYQSSVKGWKRYEEQLQPLVDALGKDLLKEYM